MVSYAHETLHPFHFTPIELYAHGTLCPEHFTPTRLYAHETLHPFHFTPIELYTHGTLCPLHFTSMSYRTKMATSGDYFYTVLEINDKILKY